MLNPRFDRQTAAELLRDSETLGTTILVILLSTYGEEILEEDPLEIYARIQDDFRATLSEEGENRLNALMFALSTNAFYEDPQTFRSVAGSLYDGDLGDLVNGALEDLTIPEILWAIWEVGNLRDDEPPFSPAVERLIEQEINDEAEDNDEIDPEEVIPYYDKFVEETKKDLMEQLIKLGVSKEELFLMDN